MLIGQMLSEQEGERGANWDEQLSHGGQHASACLVSDLCYVDVEGWEDNSTAEPTQYATYDESDVLRSEADEGPSHH